MLRTWCATGEVVCFGCVGVLRLFSPGTNAYAHSKCTVLLQLLLWCAAGAVKGWIAMAGKGNAGEMCSTTINSASGSALCYYERLVLFKYSEIVLWRYSQRNNTGM